MELGGCLCRAKLLAPHTPFGDRMRRLLRAGAALLVTAALVAAAAPRWLSSCTTVRGVQLGGSVRPDGDGKDDLAHAVTVHSATNDQLMGLEVTHEGVTTRLALRDIGPGAGNLLQLDCGDSSTGKQAEWHGLGLGVDAGPHAPGEEALPWHERRHGHTHAWGTLFAATRQQQTLRSVSRSLIEWIRVLHRTDDHLRASSRTERGTAHGGIAIVLPPANSSQQPEDYLKSLMKCRLRLLPLVRNGLTASSVRLVLLPATGPDSVLPNATTVLLDAFEDLPLTALCSSGWDSETAVVLGPRGQDPSLLQAEASSRSRPSNAAGASVPLDVEDDEAEAAAAADGFESLSLLELQTNAKAKMIPMLAQIMEPFMNEAMNLIVNPTVNRLMPDAGGETGPETNNERLPDETDGDLGEIIAVRLKAEVMNVASDAITKRIGATLSVALTRTIGGYLLAALPVDEVGGVDVMVDEAAGRLERLAPAAVSSEVTPRLYEALMPAVLKAVGLATAHAVVPALAAGLQPLRGAPMTMGRISTPERAKHCQQCTEAYLDTQHLYATGELTHEAPVHPGVLRHCRLCFSPAGAESDYFAYYGMYITHWYGEYYTEYWRLAAQEYLKKRKDQTEGSFTKEREDRFFTAMRGAERDK